MNNSLRERLRRLGVKPGREGVQRPPPRAQRPLPAFGIESLVAGREAIASGGACFVAETSYPLNHRRGERSLADVLNCSPRIAARLSRADSLAEADLSGLAFLDIETTGLAGGTGTLAFLVGIGALEPDQFVLRQFFMRSPAEEEAVLEGVAASLKDRVGLVTYNGRVFDVPIVQTRFALARRQFDLAAYPNLDLLPAARRLWRGRYENCSLGTLESEVLGLRRTEADVPGYLIPQLYVDYLRTGDAREMQRVIYHNAEDILSMVTLAAHILETFADPVGEARSGMDCLRLAMWHDDNGDAGEAEAGYRAALARTRSLPADQRPTLYERYASFLKRAGRRAEAASLWQKWAGIVEDDPAPCIELAKYYEWGARDMEQAREWAGRALVSVSHWRKGWERDEAWRDIQHRLERLGRKNEK